MAYGLSSRALTENRPAGQVAKVPAGCGTARSWHALSEACRLAIVEQALLPANETIDGYPAAL